MDIKFLISFSHRDIDFGKIKWLKFSPIIFAGLKIFAIPDRIKINNEETIFNAVVKSCSFSYKDDQVYTHVV